MIRLLLRKVISCFTVILRLRGRRSNRQRIRDASLRHTNNTIPAGINIIKYQSIIFNVFMAKSVQQRRQGLGLQRGVGVVGDGRRRRLRSPRGALQRRLDGRLEVVTSMIRGTLNG
jgi:hypothetical protein